MYDKDEFGDCAAPERTVCDTKNFCILRDALAVRDEE